MILSKKNVIHTGDGNFVLTWDHTRTSCRGCYSITDCSFVNSSVKSFQEKNFALQLQGKLALAAAGLKEKLGLEADVS